MAEYATLQVRVLFDGEIVERRFFGESQPATAEAFYSSTVDKYRRSDDSEGMTIQLLDRDDILFEETI